MYTCIHVYMYCCHADPSNVMSMVQSEMQLSVTVACLPQAHRACPSQPWLPMSCDIHSSRELQLAGSPQEETFYETHTVMEQRLVDIKVHLGGSVEDGGEGNAIYMPEQALIAFPTYFRRPVRTRKLVAVQKVDDYLDWGRAAKKVIAPRQGEVLLSQPRIYDHLAVERGHSAPHLTEREV